ncbi:uncharacterized protein FTOL_01525 [Fusarium torulosum]|uniref:BTB domain-containing protein n=1 Tax=Fusarium torulosum TaxID=33205 RepID=A0AAE8M085_9HYPO|nr:uncharacterized protein FTOL_01525 [Fusarium torulosum]
MVQGASGSGPLPIQESFQKATSSKRPSRYIFDSNGDTQLILNTYKAQPFNWQGEAVWVGEERPIWKYLKEKKENTKEMEKDLPPPTPSTPPPALLESPISITVPFREAIDMRSAGFDGVVYTRPNFSDEEDMETGYTDAETNSNSSNLRVQDWHYGETSGNLPDQVEIRMLVSAKHLALASSYFEKMFAGPFTEGKLDHSGLRQVTASDWDPEAFNIILTIIHGYHRDVPRSLNLEMLAKLAMIVDYYQCHESVELYADIWLESLKSKIPTAYGKDCILCMFISWVFVQPDIFQKMTRLALRHSGKLIEAENFPIPTDLLEQIDKARQNSLGDIFSAIYDLLDLLQEEPVCSYECSSMLLGLLTKELRKHGILSPRSAQPFYGFSIEGSKDIINGFRTPHWYIARGAKSNGNHSCTIQQKLSPALDKVENGLRIFDLQDFQFAKGHKRS